MLDEPDTEMPPFSEGHGLQADAARRAVEFPG